MLPFSEREALFEYTVFSPTPMEASAYDAALRTLVTQRIGESWKVVRTEYGVLPMEERLLRGRWGQRIFNIGAVGGAMKPSTGYAFSRIQRQAHQLARTWAEGTPKSLRPGPSRFAQYDALLLRVLMEEPERGVQIFRTLFQTTDFATVLRFLDEQTSVAEEAKLLLSLPWGPFLRGLWPVATMPLRSAA